MILLRILYNIQNFAIPQPFAYTFAMWPVAISLYKQYHPKPNSENSPSNALNIHRCHLLLCCVENPQPPNIYNLPPIWGIGYVRVAEAAKGNTFSSTMYT